jgi:hypothetical protein
MDSIALFDQVIGHQKAKKLLDLALSKPQHGYAITGPDGVGVHPLAEAFVRRLADEYKGESLSAHPDILILKREESEKGTGLKKDISVEAVREFRQRVFERPTIASRLVVYIPDADALNEAGVNALLKCIEEPAVSTVYVLAVHAIGKLPATLISRIREVRLDRVPKKEIEAWLIDQGVDALLASKASMMSDGKPGYAHLFAHDEEARKQMEESDRTIDFILHARSSGEMISALASTAIACDASDDPVTEWRKALQLWQASLRRAERANPERFYSVGRALMIAERSLGTSIPPRIWLEFALVNGFRRPRQTRSLFLPRAVPFLPQKFEST